MKAKPFKCQLCGYSSLIPEELKLHLILNHGSETPFPCPHCQYSATNDNELRLHLEQHTSQTVETQ